MLPCSVGPYEKVFHMMKCPLKFAVWLSHRMLFQVLSALEWVVRRSSILLCLQRSGCMVHWLVYGLLAKARASSHAMLGIVFTSPATTSG